MKMSPNASGSSSSSTSSSRIRFREIGSVNEKNKIAPILTQLASKTEMASYGTEQWKFLLHAGDVTVWVAHKDDDDDGDEKEDVSTDNDILPRSVLGCVLKIKYSNETVAAYGMMLVSPEARGQGLARRLLTKAMLSQDEKKELVDYHILGTCTDMGRPLYEKVGYQRVSTVTRMTISLDKMNFAETDLANDSIPNKAIVSIQSNDNSHDHHDLLLDQLVTLDGQATGLDRSQTLRALASLPYVSSAAVMHGDRALLAALVTHHTGASSIMVGPLIGQAHYVPKLLQDIRDHFSQSQVRELNLIVSDHPSLVQVLTSAGFAVSFELGAMTLHGKPFPGQRDMYLGLIHPTLG